MSIEDRQRCITAFELILNGRNPYYKEQLKDPDFVHLVESALQEEKRELSLWHDTGGKI